MDMGTPRAPLKDHKKEKKRKEETSIRAFLEEKEYIVAKSIFPLLFPFFFLLWGAVTCNPFLLDGVPIKYSGLLQTGHILFNFVFKTSLHS